MVELTDNQKKWIAIIAAIILLILIYIIWQAARQKKRQTDLINEMSPLWENKANLINSYANQRMRNENVDDTINKLTIADVELGKNFRKYYGFDVGNKFQDFMMQYTNETIKLIDNGVNNEPYQVDHLIKVLDPAFTNFLMGTNKSYNEKTLASQINAYSNSILNTLTYIISNGQTGVNNLKQVSHDLAVYIATRTA